MNEEQIALLDALLKSIGADPKSNDYGVELDVLQDLVLNNEVIVVNGKLALVTDASV